MEYQELGSSGIKVSEVCLGTWTMGKKSWVGVDDEESIKTIHTALDRGINFIDTAELYPVPATAETSGRTSKIIGNWIHKRNNRDKVILASKIAGPGDYTAHIRTNGFSKEGINDAISKELKRLQTDYIDLYQLHWPERQTNTFGVRDYKHNPNDSWKDNFNEVIIISAGPAGLHCAEI